MKKNDGYSLVQLLVVLAILGIFTIFIANSLSRSTITRSGFNAAVNKYIADFAFMKQLASRENRFVVIIFNTNGKSYTIRRQTTIGDLNSWTDVKGKVDVSLFGGKTFFDGGNMQDFAVNSIGEIYVFPIAGPPTQVTLNFQNKDLRGGKNYIRTINIFALGGIKVGLIKFEDI